MKIIILLCFLCYLSNAISDLKALEHYDKVSSLVKAWADAIGEELFKLSSTMSKKQQLFQAFKKLEDEIYVEDGPQIVEDTAKDLQELMKKKVEAVQRIAEYAEYLSYTRKTDPLFANSSYNYYAADNLTNTESDAERQNQLAQNVRQYECAWWCHQKKTMYDPTTLGNLRRSDVEQLFQARGKYDDSSECDCDNLSDPTKSEEYYQTLPLEYSQHFQDHVNLNLSIVKLSLDVYYREQSVLEGARWSEPLDLVFKKNFADDPTLTWQYFTSPHGYMRHYPAIKWSEETYNQTYDPRTRSWYTEAMTSPKDMIILLDRSGSMDRDGASNILAIQAVNIILDTLNDNDFINIYTFTNTTEPLVPCFTDTLVQVENDAMGVEVSWMFTHDTELQHVLLTGVMIFLGEDHVPSMANEENLRLLRESLRVVETVFKADIIVGLRKAFDLLEKFRIEKGAASGCNQAIMLITEGLDYDISPDIFAQYNFAKNRPVRIFTYLLGKDDNDGRIMEWIACANMGYFVNISTISEVKEKVLNYLPVMSRPINYDISFRQAPIWSYLYVDLADRRLSNWLWKKYEGIRQRRVLLDHVKRLNFRCDRMLTSNRHMLLKMGHDYDMYDRPHSYTHLTTVSLPVYGRRKEDIGLIGVAGIDVSIKLLKSLIPHHKLGVNGYAFILTNNGYVLLHPGHRPEFSRILKPTFNRVDFLEVEILDDDSEPRQFSPSILALREAIVKWNKSDITQKSRTYEQNVKFTIDNMKRIILTKKTYHVTDLGPFRFVIALPDKYGLVMVNNTDVALDKNNVLSYTSDWKVHPEWRYCDDSIGDSPESKVKYCLTRGKYKHLLRSLIFDANVTRRFSDPILFENENFVKKYSVMKVFLATQSGLTRWRDFETPGAEDVDFEEKHNKAIDEEWYIRAVEENFHLPDIFLYEVPFETSGNKNKTLITATSTIFVGNGIRKTPIAVTGLLFGYSALDQMYQKIAVNTKLHRISCKSKDLECFILDNNAYVMLCDEPEYIGRYFGDIRPDIMYHLVKNSVYKETRMYDYQAICYNEPPRPKPREKKKKKKQAKSSATSVYRTLISHVMHLTNWALTTALTLVRAVSGGEHYQSIKPDTLAFERLQIKKTLPTPCDHEMWLFTLGTNFTSSVYDSNKTSKFECRWYYVVEKIPHSNLVFLAVNNKCIEDTVNTYTRTPQPQEINYNDSLPCYIETKFNYSRQMYMRCYNRDLREDNLNNRSSYNCGHTWPDENGNYPGYQNIF